VNQTITDRIASLVSEYGDQYECMQSQVSVEINRLERKYNCAWIVSTDLSEEEREKALADRRAKRDRNFNNKMDRRRAKVTAYFAEQDKFSELVQKALEAGNMEAAYDANKAREEHRQKNLNIIGANKREAVRKKK
jgi:hypothetical protein